MVDSPDKLFRAHHRPSERCSYKLRRGFARRGLAWLRAVCRMCMYRITRCFAFTCGAREGAHISIMNARMSLNIDITNRETYAELSGARHGTLSIWRSREMCSSVRANF